MRSVNAPLNKDIFHVKLNALREDEVWEGSKKQCICHLQSNKYTYFTICELYTQTKRWGRWLCDEVIRNCNIISFAEMSKVKGHILASAHLLPLSNCKMKMLHISFFIVFFLCAQVHTNIYACIFTYFN